MSGRRLEDRRKILAVAAVLANPSGEILLIRRAKGESWSGFWAFPGGQIQDAESPQSAIEREIMEEVGLSCQAHEALFQGKTPRGWPIEYWMCTTDNEQIVMQESEVSSYKWVAQNAILSQPDLLPAMSLMVSCMYRRKILPRKLGLYRP